MAVRFRACFELPSYSLARAADLIVSQVQRLGQNASGAGVDLGDLLLETRTLLACASPILIDVAAPAPTAGIDRRPLPDGGLLLGMPTDRGMSTRTRLASTRL